jgi:hypothetical protein
MIGSHLDEAGTNFKGLCLREMDASMVSRCLAVFELCLPKIDMSPREWVF